jgi:hypothetical protein
MITIDVVLNCNRSLLKNYIKKVREMETQGKHMTQIKRNLEYLCVLVLIFKKVLYFTFRKNPSRTDLNLSIYTKIVTTENHWTSYNICLKIEYNLNEIP